jgi:hypothetical protein
MQLHARISLMPVIEPSNTIGIEAGCSSLDAMHVTEFR